MSNKEIIEKYNIFADKYDKSEYISEVFGIRNLRKNFIKNASGKVLELGIGTGQNLKYYSDSCEIFGIDFSSAMLNVCYKKAQNLEKNIQLYNMDAEELGFLDNYFDVVVDFLNICTYKNPLKVLNEAKRICKQNGKIFLFEHGKSNLNLLSKIQDITTEKHAKTLGCYWNKNIDSILEESKLKINSEEKYFFGIFTKVIAEP